MATNDTPKVIHLDQGPAESPTSQAVSETRDAVQAVSDSAEREPEKRVSFAEAVKLLEGKLDLEAARADAVKSHGRWGLVDALIKAGVIESAEQYGTLFDKVTINEADLKKVRESLERGEKMLPIFDAGTMNPDKLFDVLFTKGGLPHSTQGIAYEKLSTIRKIDPNDIPDLQSLCKQPLTVDGPSILENRLAFKAAYEKAKPLEPTGSRVIFTPDEHESTHVDTSATEEMFASAKSAIKLMDPNADFIRFRTQIDAGLVEIAGGLENFGNLNTEAYRALLNKTFSDKTIDQFMPDREKITRYSDFVLEDGGVMGLRFLPTTRVARLYWYYPNSSGDGKIGSRPALG